MLNAAFRDWPIWLADANISARIFAPTFDRIRIITVSFCLVFAFTSCSGDNGVADEIPGIDGTWQGNLATIQDQCGLGIDVLNEETHQITVSGSAVTLTAADGRILEGEATSDNSFTVETSDGQAFPTIDRVEYSSIADRAAAVRVSHIWSRPGGCISTWEGTMQMVAAE